MLPRLEGGYPFSISTRTTGAVDAIASFGARGTTAQAWITDIAGSVDGSPNSTGAELFVYGGSTVLFNINLGSPNNLPFSHHFLSPLRPSANTAVSVRVGSSTATAWAFIGGYIVS